MFQKLSQNTVIIIRRCVALPILRGTKFEDRVMAIRALTIWLNLLATNESSKAHFIRFSKDK